MNPPCRVTRVPTFVASPLGGSTDFAPPIHSGSRLGSNITAATRPGFATIVRTAVTSIMRRSLADLAASDQADRLVPLEEIEADARRLTAWTGEAAVTVEK